MRHMKLTKEDKIKELVIVKMLEPPKDYAKTLAFITKNQNEDLFVHITIIFPHTNIEEVSLKD